MGITAQEVKRWVRKQERITKILNQQEYCGDVINFKTYSKSYKNKKRIPNSPENQAEKTERGKVQKLVIYYNCIGSIYLPEDSSPPTPDIHLQTRKGVTTSYGGLATI